MMELVEVLGIPLLICLEMIAILGYLGIHVLKREVIFIDIALAQIAAVGALGAELAFEAHGHSLLGYACAFGATLVAAAFYSLVRRRVVFYIDNESARFALISMYSPRIASANILAQIAEVLSEGEIIAWFARVPSEANVADAQSRLDFSGVWPLACDVVEACM